MLLFEYNYWGIRNMDNQHLAVMIRNSAEKNSDKTAIRSKVDGQWKGNSYSEMVNFIDALASGLLELNVEPGEMVGIFSANRPEWPVVDFSVLSVRGVTVPIYGTNTAKQAAYIINDASIRILFVGDQGQYDKVKSVMGECSSLKIIVAVQDSMTISGDESMYYSDLLKKGEEGKRTEDIKKLLEAADPEELCTLIYTSGTTGDPKGVMLKHSNFAHQIRAVDAHFNVTSEDKSLCFLPLSHVYERTWSYCVFNYGAENNYLDDTTKILEYLGDVRPTAMVSVPRLYEKIYATVHDRLERGSGIKRALFNFAFRNGKKYAYKKYEKKFIGPWLGFKHAIADKLVLSKMRDVVGGKKNFFSAGGAPLSKDIEEFFFSAGLMVSQGYGLSETSPMLTYNPGSRFKFGTVGFSVPEVELRIDEETGEIQAKGPNIMIGYYNKPEATKEAFTEDGWFKTGDVGVIDSEGFLHITDRIKDLIITSGGKNIAPLHIETLVGIDFYIEQICTIGDKRKYISALIVPNYPALEEWATSKGVTFVSREDLIANKQVVEFFEERIKLNSSELAQYEKIKSFTLLATEFSQEGGELTPTLKVKRKVISNKYGEIIDKMYADA